MIDGEHPLLLGVEFEHRKIDDPQKFALAAIAQIEARAELQPDVAEDRTDFVGIPRDHQHGVTSFKVGYLRREGLLAIADIFARSAPAIRQDWL